MIPTRYRGDEEIENLINITERHCKIGKVVRTPKGNTFDRGGYVPSTKHVFMLNDFDILTGIDSQLPATKTN